MIDDTSIKIAQIRLIDAEIAQLEAQIEERKLARKEIVSGLACIWYLEGHGAYGTIADEIIFVGTHEACLQKVQSLGYVMHNKSQFAPASSSAGEQVAGILKKWTPLDDAYYQYLDKVQE